LYRFNALLALAAFCLFGVWGQAQAPNGLPFEHRIRISVEKNNVIFSIVPLLFLEQAGVGLIDFDQDGALDIYLTNGPGFANGLLHNQGGEFSDAAKSAGVDFPGGTAALAGDIDNDGLVDLFVARRNKNILYLNQGAGRFENVTARAGVGGGNQLTSNAAFCDLDNDGFLDLYLGNRRNHAHDELHPNQLFHNNGDSTFTELGRQAGVDNPVTRTLLAPGQGQNSTMAVACFDYDADGDQDIVAAVDFSTVTLFKNRWRESGRLRFENVTVAAGLGRVGNWMGLAIGDFNGDALPDIFATSWGSSANIYRVNIPVESTRHALYLNQGNGTFIDAAQRAVLADWPFGWGAVALDWENDGDLDLYYVGNMVEDPARPVRDNPGHLFLNDGGGVFEESAGRYDLGNVDEAGVFQVGHGVATGDVDGDGFFDIVVANAAYRTPAQRVIPGVPKLFLNADFVHQQPGHWLKLKLAGRDSNRSGIGARVLLYVAGKAQLREVQSGNGHMGQNSLEVGFGVGQATVVDRLEIHWPSGTVDRLKKLSVDQTLTVSEGQFP